MKKIILVLGIIVLVLCKTGHSAWYSTEQIANYQFDPITRSLRIAPSTSAVFNVSGSSIIVYQGGLWRIIESTGVSYQGGQWKIVESTNWITGGHVDVSGSTLTILGHVDVFVETITVTNPYIPFNQSSTVTVVNQYKNVVVDSGTISVDNLNPSYKNVVIDSGTITVNGNVTVDNQYKNVVIDSGSITVNTCPNVFITSGIVSLDVTGSTMTVVNENYKNMISSGWIVGKFTAVTSATLSVTDKVSKYRLLYRNTTNVDQEMNYTATNIFKGGNAEYLVNGIVSEPSIDVPTPIDFNFNSLAVEATIYYRMQTIQPK